MSRPSALLYDLILSMGSDDFPEWLSTEIDKLGISQAAFGRKAKVSRQTINEICNRKRPHPDERTVERIARALGYTTEYVFRIAGILPPDPSGDSDPLYERANWIFQHLPESEQQRALDWLEYLYEKQTRPETTSQKMSKSPSPKMAKSPSRS